jgi:hypothetical protein
MPRLFECFDEAAVEFQLEYLPELLKYVLHFYYPTYCTRTLACYICVLYNVLLAVFC